MTHASVAVIVPHSPADSAPLSLPTAAGARDMPAGTLDAIRAGGWFAALPCAMRESLLAAGTLRKLNTGETLFARGDPFDGVYCVAMGTILVQANSAAGKAALLGALTPGAWFGEICLFDGLARTHDALAASPATVLHVRRDRLAAMLSAHPAWWREFGTLLASKTRETFHYVEEVQVLSPVARTARRLAALARVHGSPPAQAAPPSIRLPQEQLGQMLGLSRQTVNHALRELETRGLLRLRYAEIELLDLAALEALT